MSTTLTNGLKLPDKGSVDWYADMQSNYAILDGAVGTVAEHTTQIAGKAPLVHTHTKSDITDFPAYGTTAGTICEGNDSRLSDARTPVAHTHGKSDVTDLLNSNFIPSANNSYDLGSSTNQWNNLYAKNYYYNGVAWGLDKANEWTRYNIFTGNVRPIRLRGSNNDIYNVQPQSPIFSQIDFVDKNNETMSYILFQHRTDATETHRLCLRQKRITLDAYYSIDLNNLGDFYPEQNNAINLGTSTNKWKTLNGINPGSLSFPSGGTTENTDWFDISGAIKPVGGNTTDFTGNRNDYIPPVDGWLALAVNDCSKLSVWCGSLSYGQNSISLNSKEDSLFLMPVIAGKNLDIRIKGTSWYSARLIVPKGNV